LDEAVNLALQNNPGPKAARAALNAALARIGIAKSTGGVQVTLPGSAALQRGFGQGAVGGTSNVDSLSLDVSLPVYTGGRVKASKRKAEADARTQLALAQQTEQDLAGQTILAYLGILQDQQLLQVAESNLTTSRERRRIAGVRFDAGAAARLEVLRADSDLATAEQSRIAAANNQAQGKAVLNILMGREPETPLNVVPFTTLVLPPQARFPLAAQATAIAAGGAIPASSALRAAAQSLPNLQAGQSQIESGEQNVALQKAQRKPNIGASLLGAIRNPVAGVGRFLVSVGLGLAQTIFDSGNIKSQVSQAQALVDQAKFNQDNQELQVANVIESSLLQLDSARKRQASADVGALAAAEALRAAQLGYAAGASTALDVTDAQNALVIAQTDSVNARFEVAQAQVQLAAATSQTTAGRTSASNGVSTVATSSTSAATGSSGVGGATSSSSTTVGGTP
jgi:outer membrane protein TolC